MSELQILCLVFSFDNFHTHRCVRAVRHIPAKILVHIPGGGNINLCHPGLDLRLILIMGAYADEEILCPLTLNKNIKKT